jgi:ABC-type transporter Mla MlaB component
MQATVSLTDNALVFSGEINYANVSALLVQARDFLMAHKQNVVLDLEQVSNISMATLALLIEIKAFALAQKKQCVVRGAKPGLVAMAELSHADHYLLA